MNFELPESVRELRARVEGFMQCRVIACEPIYFEQLSDPSMRWRLVPILKELREEARSQGFWNFPLGRHLQGRDMTLSNYAPIAEVISQSPFGSEVFNCYSGTVLNAQLLDQFASEGVKSEFLDPLVRGEIRACIAITEPHVPASDPTSLGLTAVRDGNEYVINGQKSWATGMMMEECRAILLLFCCSHVRPLRPNRISAIRSSSCREMRRASPSAKINQHLATTTRLMGILILRLKMSVCQFTICSVMKDRAFG